MSVATLESKLGEVEALANRDDIGSEQWYYDFEHLNRYGVPNRSVSKQADNYRCGSPEWYALMFGRTS